MFVDRGIFITNSTVFNLLQVSTNVMFYHQIDQNYCDVLCAKGHIQSTVWEGLILYGKESTEYAH